MSRTIRLELYQEVNTEFARAWIALIGESV